jgi:hypothetical protein
MWPTLLEITSKGFHSYFHGSKFLIHGRIALHNDRKSNRVELWGISSKVYSGGYVSAQAVTILAYHVAGTG